MQEPALAQLLRRLTLCIEIRFQYETCSSPSIRGKLPHFLTLAVVAHARGVTCPPRHRHRHRLLLLLLLLLPLLLLLVLLQLLIVCTELRSSRKAVEEFALKGLKGS